jgi:hypothetical protein
MYFQGKFEIASLAMTISVNRCKSVSKNIDYILCVLCELWGYK